MYRLLQWHGQPVGLPGAVPCIARCSSFLCRGLTRVWPELRFAGVVGRSLAAHFRVLLPSPTKCAAAGGVRIELSGLRLVWCCPDGGDGVCMRPG
eukprot:351182-Chlamydomonas_euryale.AAC.7